MKIGEALVPAVTPLLRDLGVWERFLAGGHLRSPGTAAAWGAPELSSVDFIFDPNGCGWHLDRLGFDLMLRRCAEEAGATVLEASRIRAVERRPGHGWTLRVERQRASELSVRCRVLLDATGRSAALSRGLGARRRRCESTLAVYALLRAAEEDHDARTLVEATPDGWWYTALVPGRRRVVAHLLDPGQAGRELRTDAALRRAMSSSRHLRPRLSSSSEAHMLHGPCVAAAHSVRLEPAAGDGWVAVGDAALAFDPISSQGILNALFTGVAGARAAAGQLLGDQRPVDAYLLRLEEIWAAYRHNLRAHYRLEQRWPERPFWARRTG